MSGRNVLIFMADEHARSALGCYGHELVTTPVLDRLAATGTRFTQAYTPSPVCVPARAAFATGRYVFQTRCWSNAQPYTGDMPGWGHRLIAEGHEVVSVGKLHYRSRDDNNGFSREIMPLHVRDGVGFVYGLLRRERHAFDTEHFAHEIGPGDDEYTDFDRRVCEHAVAWLKSEAGAKRNKPWVLFVSFLRPHYPLTSPKEFYDLYPLERITPPRFAGGKKEFANPVLAAFRSYYDYDDHFDDHRRLVARASYYGLCSFVDDLVGRVLAALQDSGHDKDTAVIYTSDHGESIGEHGLWTKMTMYEDSVGIPLILSGAGAPAGVSRTPTSLVDIYQTVLEAAGAVLSDEDRALPGRSLYGIAAEPDADRAVFSEYHDGGAITGFFMVRYGRWKYICYPGFAPQLFDLEADPFEQNDLGNSTAHSDIRADCHRKMVEIGDPDLLNELAFADQAKRIEELGGVDAILATEAFDFTPAR
ncbi:MAG: sulfatase-like hydrolase/transferase [Alphaproteobacteria bacterium]